MKSLTVLLLALLFTMSGAPMDVQLEKIKLPPGFEISVYADDLKGARSLELTDNGTLFVGSMRGGEGRVYAVVDSDGDQKADARYIIDEGLTMPNGVAFRDGALYVAEGNRRLRPFRRRQVHGWGVKNQSSSSSSSSSSS